MNRYLIFWAIIFTAITLSAQYIILEETFDTSPNLPAGWVDLSYHGNHITEGIGVGGSQALLSYVYGDLFGLDLDKLDLYTPMIEDLPEGSTLTFDYRIMGHNSTTIPGVLFNANIEVFISNEEMSSVFPIHTVDDHVMSAEYRTIDISLAMYAGSSGRVNFYCLSNYSEVDIHIDNVKITTTTTPFEYDLKAASLSGKFAPMLGVAYPYTITVKNIGLATIAEGGYSVSLMKSDGGGQDIVIGSADGVGLSYNDSASYTIYFTPSTMDNAFIYGFVNLAGDLSPYNNYSTVIPITIMPPDQVYLGDPNSNLYTPLIPFNLYYNESLAQTIYSEGEIGVEGLIETIRYNFSCGASYPNSPMNVKVWMAYANKATFASLDDAIPYADFTLVYNGGVTLNTSGDIDIVLDTPFPYENGNIAVMTQRMHTNNYYAQNNEWLSTAVPGNKVGLVYVTEGSAIPDISGGYPTFMGVAQFFPNTSFLMNSTGPFTTLTGTVTNAVTSVAISGVEIALQGENRRVFTGDNGEYTFRMLPAGSIAITASRHGYVDYISNAVMVDQQTTTLNLQLTPLPTVTVSGVILASDTGFGLAGAVVTLAGYANFDTVTDTEGGFSIDEVYAEQTYNLAVTAPRFACYTSEVAVGESDLQLTPITLIEMANPPQNVIATPDADVIHITWGLPNSLLQEYRLGEEPALPKPDPPTRALIGYDVYRATMADVDNEANWALLASAAITTEYADNAWGAVAIGNYYYLVRALYTGNQLSSVARSNVISKGATVNISVSSHDGVPAIGANIELQHSTEPIFAYNATITAGQEVSISNVAYGSYTLTVSKAGYYTFMAQLDINVTEFNTSAILGAIDTIYYEDFDSSELPLPRGWTQTVNNPDFPWFIDSATYIYVPAIGMVPYNAHNNSEGMAISTSFGTETSGQLMPNNWLISPQIHIPDYALAARLEYYVTTYSSWPDHYGVYISRTGTAVADFTLLFDERPPGGNYINQAWTYRTIDISSYVGQDVYIAFRHYNSSNRYYIMLDDVSVIMANPTSIDDATIAPLATGIIGNYPNPFNPVTTIAFNVAREGLVNIEVYNIKGQKVKTLVNEVMSTGQHSVLWNGDDAMGHNVSSGVYFYRMVSGGCVSVKKMVMVK